MDYSFQILSASSPYIDATSCKVWALNSSYFLGYTLLDPPTKNLLPPALVWVFETVKFISQDCDGLQLSYFVSFKSLYSCNFVQSLSFQLLMVPKQYENLLPLVLQSCSIALLRRRSPTTAFGAFSPEVWGQMRSNFSQWCRFTVNFEQKQSALQLETMFWTFGGSLEWLRTPISMHIPPISRLAGTFWKIITPKP